MSNKRFPRTYFSLGPLLQPLLSRIPAHIRILGELRLHWEDYAGERIAAHSVPAFLDAQTRKLTIYCDSPEWNTGITTNASSLLMRFPKHMEINSLRCILKKTNMPVRFKKPIVESNPLPPLTPQEEAQLDEEIQAYKLDDETAQATKDYLSLCLRMRRKHG
ncbi:MAG: DciA family protein [Brevinema sp.]